MNLEKFGMYLHLPLLDNAPNYLVGCVIQKRLENYFSMAVVQTYGETTHTFIERGNYKGLFLPGYKPARMKGNFLPKNFHNLFLKTLISFVVGIFLT